jgi:putative chitinase
MLTRDIILRVCPRAPDACVEGLLASQGEAQVTSPLRAALYLAQVAHESRDLTHLEENLSYSPERISAVWPHRFPTAAAAAPYAHAPEKLASSVYGLRLGNGDEASGEGWLYRGRGGLMITGRDNYKACGLFLGLDMVAHPELAAQPEHAFRVAAWFWRSHGLNTFADAGDVKGATKRIQGAFEGLEQRQARFDLICPLVGALSLHLIS